MPKQPQVSWAQRKDSVYLTVEVVDPENVEVKLEDSQVSVSCKKDEIDYAIVLPLFASIKTEDSRWAVKRHLIIHLDKAEAARWPRLLADTQKRSNLKCDWNMWLDTDDENEAGAKGAFNMDDFNMAGMGGMGGPGGLDLDQDYGNFDEEESDSEPDDEKVRDDNEVDTEASALDCPVVATPVEDTTKLGTA